MALPVSEEAYDVVASWWRGPREEVRAALTTLDGPPAIELRVYVSSGDAHRGTRHGIRLRPEELPLLRRAVDELADAVERRGW